MRTMNLASDLIPVRPQCHSSSHFSAESTSAEPSESLWRICARWSQASATPMFVLCSIAHFIFEGPSSKTGDQALRIQNAIAAKLGVSARVSVVTAAELAAIVRENPLHSVAGDPSRFLAAFVLDRAALTKIKPLIHQSWVPDQLAVGSCAAYIWRANGIMESKLL